MIGTIRGVVTLILMLLFIALTVWAWGRQRKASFGAAVRMPLKDDSNHPGGGL